MGKKSRARKSKQQLLLKKCFHLSCKLMTLKFELVELLLLFSSSGIFCSVLRKNIHQTLSMQNNNNNSNNIKHNTSSRRNNNKEMRWDSNPKEQLIIFSKHGKTWLKYLSYSSICLLALFNFNFFSMTYG